MTEPSPQTPDPLLVVLSGPSGVGKDAVLALMRQEPGPFHFAVTATTRPMRPDERDGTDYTFVSEQEFRRMIDDGELLEWAEVYGYLYGVPKGQIIGALGEGKDVIVKPDVQGAATIRKLAPDGLFIFLAPSSLEELADRLRLRMTESSEALQLRLETAQAEMDESAKFDHVVVNRQDRLDETVAEIRRIVDHERLRAPRKRMRL